MKKSKLFGSRLVENVFNPKTPRVIMFSDSDSITRQVFEEGDILDANSIRKILLKGGFSSGGHSGGGSNPPSIDYVDLKAQIDKLKNYIDGKDNIINDARRLIEANTTGIEHNSTSIKELRNIINNFNISNVLYVGEVEPSTKDVLWLDTSEGVHLDSSNSDELLKIKEAIRDIYSNMGTINKMILNGIVAGDSNSSARQMIMRTADPIRPTEITEEHNVNTDPTQPNTTGVEPTVNHISIKMDTAVNFSKNRQNLIDGELLYYTDRKKVVLYKDGKFNVVGSEQSSGGSGGGISVDDLYATHLDHLTFTDGDSAYNVQVDQSGKITVRKKSIQVTKVGNVDPAWKVYVDHLLCINEVYCGGVNNDNQICSHNFIELANGSNSDINLNGLMLLYTDGTLYGNGHNGFKWKTLKLDGIIKAGSTYLIRGQRCNTTKSSFIDVNTYDQIWMDGDNPIGFSQDASSFYLCVGDVDNNWVYDQQGNPLDKGELKSPWNKNFTYQGYIDSCGFGSGSVYEGDATFQVNSTDNAKDCVYIRWFMLEPSKQGNKAYGARKTKSLWTYINMNTQTQFAGNVPMYYYSDSLKQKFTPKASWEGKNFFTNKTSFDPFKPNCVRCTFGIHATAGDTNKASRCFNWVSVGNYDEYLRYRKVGQTEWTVVRSITQGDKNNTAAINKFIDHYKRLRWRTPSGMWVTTHKVVLSNIFEAGEYEYQVCRFTDESYKSKIYKTNVASNSDVAANGFTFIQETDQQGFSWLDYRPWFRSAGIMAEENFDFLVNTGDIAQSGNRENEWIDYYEALDTFIPNKTEMFTIGNNDLCSEQPTLLTDGEDATSKFNHINVLRYFTFELDPDFDYNFTWNGGTYPLYSLYYYTYGDFSFVCLNSETAEASSKTYNNGIADASFAQAANQSIETWFESLMNSGKLVKKPFVYMHEMPFTMVTWQFMKGSAGREGSHLNTHNTAGKYRFSRLFKKHGIKMVFGGHKHTYTLSKPIYDAPENYITSENKVNPAVDIMADVDDTLSRRPVIQVTRQQDIDPSNNYARYELVDTITAPTYVMSQATGYKLVSNKEQPSGDEYLIPWLMSYFKAASNATAPTENRKQHYPMYIKYKVTNDSVVVEAKQIHGVWDVNEDKNTAKWDPNKQIPNLTTVSMTCEPTSEADKQAYNITSTETYTITL